MTELAYRPGVMDGASSGPTPELLTMGRVGVDLYPEQIGVPLAQVRTFRKMLGGSATNVAVAAARLGRRSGVITKVGDDPFGPYVRQALEQFGVDPSRVGTHPTLRTPVVFCEIFPPDNFPILFYRQPTRARPSLSGAARRRSPSSATCRLRTPPGRCSTSGPSWRSSSSAPTACSAPPPIRRSPCLRSRSTS